MESWEEIEQAADDGRHELHLNGDVISSKLERNEMKLPNKLFELVALNYLEISDTSLIEIPDDMAKLTNLINLALHRNSIEKVGDFFNHLPKLKFFDMSFNKLTSLPEQLNLGTVHTLNLSNNELTSLGDLSGAVNLSILHIEHNELEELPTGLVTLKHLLEVHASNNLINTLPDDLHTFPALKLFDVSENKLKEVPHSMSQCQRLKTLKLEGNPLKDNRLRKMTTQCNTRAILEYIAKQSGGDGGKKGKKGKKGKNQPVKEEAEENVRRIVITPNTDDEKRVICDASVKDVRPYLCCTVIKNLDLSDETVFKNFLSLQTKLHENECDMRTRATIATHNATGLKFPLVFKASHVDQTVIHALGKKKECNATILIQNLKDERDALKQKKKRQPKTGLYKFIELVDGQEMIASVRNQDGDVISLPPITNGEKTKIGASVGDVFIEISSPVSIAQCKYVMEELIKKMFQQNFNSDMEGDEGLWIEPIRVVDENEDLRIVYPSKIDIDFSNIPVKRL